MAYFSASFWAADYWAADYWINVAVSPAPTPSPSLRDYAGRGERGGEWQERDTPEAREQRRKILGQAEYDIHRIGLAVPPDYLRRLDAAAEAAVQSPAPEIPDWLEEFVAAEPDWRLHLLAVETIIMRLDSALQALAREWLEMQIAARIRDDEDAIAMLLLS